MFVCWEKAGRWMVWFTHGVKPNMKARPTNIDTRIDIYTNTTQNKCTITHTHPCNNKRARCVRGYAKVSKMGLKGATERHQASKTEPESAPRHSKVYTRCRKQTVRGLPVSMQASRQVSK